MADEIREVKVEFTYEGAGGIVFRDALYYPLSSWPISDAQIDADKQARIDAWLAQIAPQPGPAPQDAPPDQVQ